MKKIIALALAAAGCGKVLTAPETGDQQDAGSGSGSADSDDEVDPPPPSTPLTFYGTIRDETGDQLTYEGGRPLHKHTGQPVQITGDCPVVHKYAYLMDRNPQFGRETKANPLAIKITDDASLDPNGSSFQVRTEDNRVLVPWKVMTANDGSYVMTLNRDDSPELGTFVGKLFVEAKFHDKSGNEIVKTQCFEHHPLAAPLEADVLKPASLFDIKLTLDPTLSPLLNPGNGVDVASLALTQTTAEAIDLTISGQAPTGIGTMTVTDQWFKDIPYDTNPQVDCSLYPDSCTPAPSASTTVGPINTPLAGTWTLRLVDDATGATACQQSSALHARCTIPPRGPTEPPHGYHVVLTDSVEKAVWPTTPHPDFVDLDFGSTHLTGTVVDGALPCTNLTVVGTKSYCTQWNWYDRVVSLKAVSIAFDAISLSVTSNVGEPTVPSLAGSLTMPAIIWDAGIRL